LNEVEEKLSALYDGELSEAEIDEVLSILEDDVNLKKKLSGYALISSSMKKDKNNIQSISSKKINYQFWFSNTITAAATVLITFFALNQYDINRMGEDISATNKLNVAINSKEAKDLANRVEENLVDHVMHVINNPGKDITTAYDVDLRNVGYVRSKSENRQYNKGNKNFILRVEKKNLGIKNIKYWKHGEKMIYVIPLSEGKVATLYGNIDSKTALEIANSINIK
jgi:hypothetical protein